MRKNMHTGTIKHSQTFTSAVSRQEKLSNLEIFQDKRLPIKEQKARVEAVIRNELTPKQRETVSLVFQGNSIKEVAEIQNVSPSTVSRTFNRGLTRLRRFLRY